MQEEISFGVWLRKQRRALDLTRQALADQVGCAEVTLRRIEAGTLKPSKELAGILLEKLGIPKSERLQWIFFARGVSGFPLESVPSSNTPSTNLPAQITTFIGREKEQLQVINLLAKHRLATLTGSGGVGKTRLAIKICEQVLADYPDGVWLIELAPILDPLLVPYTIAITFDLRNDPQHAVVDVLANYLHEKKILIILDNCEHLLNACAPLADTLLKRCPNLKILATSREPLGILGEVAYRVPSLGVPTFEQMVESPRDYESVQLFEERAQLTRQDFSLTMENASSIVEICRRLDGIPLAIELAAARVNMLSPEQIAAQLKECFKLLTGGYRTSLPRQQTIRSSIDWSWNLLTASEQLLLRRLSVFAGGWTLTAAEFVCRESDVDSFQILDCTTQLAAKSLISVREEAEFATRYRMLETVREYAFEKLKASDETKIICLRHLIFFGKMAEEAERNFTGPSQALWYDHLDNELDNLRVALSWFDGIEQAESRLEFATRLWRYWKSRGHSSEGRGHLRRIFEGLLLEPKRQTLAYARALYADGALAYNEGDLASAEQSHETALKIFRKFNDKAGIADCLIGLGNTALSYGNYEAAQGLYEECLVLRKALSDKQGVARLLGNLGLLAYFQMEYLRARDLYLESLNLFRDLRDDAGIAFVLDNLGDIVHRQGDLLMAQSFYKESVEIHLRLKNQSGTAFSILGQADIAFEQSDFAKAAPLYKQCLVLFQQAADYIGLPFALESIAALALVNNQLENAARVFGAADQLRKSTGVALPLSNQPTYEKNLSNLQQRLESSIFGKAWSEGRTMTVDEVIILARALTGD